MTTTPDREWTPGKGWHPELTKPCKPDCKCGKHFRTRLHNELISRGVRRANARRAVTGQRVG